MIATVNLNHRVADATWCTQSIIACGVSELNPSANQKEQVLLTVDIWYSMQTENGALNPLFWQKQNTPHVRKNEPN